MAQPNQAPAEHPDHVVSQVDELKRNHDVMKMDGLIEAEKKQTLDSLNNLKAKIEHTEGHSEHVDADAYEKLQNSKEILETIENEVHTSPTEKTRQPTRPVPQSGFEQAMGTITVASTAFFESIQNTLRNMGAGSLKALRSLASFLKFDWGVSILNKMIQPKEIRDKIAQKFGKDSVREAYNDDKALEELTRKYIEKINGSNDTLTEGNYSFETFYEERIDALPRPNGAKYSIGDLLQKTPAEKKEEQEKNDTTLNMLKEKGAVESNGVWSITTDLGIENGLPINTVSFKKNGNRWEWKTNKDTNFRTNRLDTELEGLMPEQKQARIDMNSLANLIGVQAAPANNNESNGENGEENSESNESDAELTPEQIEAKKKMRYIKALVNAFNKAAGSDIVAYEPEDSWRQIASKLSASLGNEEFQDSLALETENEGWLEATDTADTNGLIDQFVTDKNLIENWGQLIIANPIQAVEKFMEINPTEKVEGWFYDTPALEEKSRNSVVQIQEILKRELKDLNVEA